MRFLCILLLGIAGTTLQAQDFLDPVEDALTFSALDSNVRAQIRGTLDLEYYHFPQPPPGLIEAPGHDLFNPRLTLLLDSQLGRQFYFFTQLRVDRHFDPTNRGAQIRLDEYALRFTPWDDGRITVQIGKFATVFGHWVERHLSWNNPFVTAPLVYENALPLEDSLGGEIPFIGRRRDEKHHYIPVIWGPNYASGISLAGAIGKFDYAAELKNAALSSRPETWDATRRGFDDPTLNARIGFRPNEAWNIGLSGSNGAYLSSDAEATLPPGRDIGDYHETSLAEDISYAHGHLQLAAEFHETRFEIPRLGDGQTFGYFLEARYQLTPQLSGAVRWNQQLFNEISNGVGGHVEFAPDICRLEVAGTYRFTAHVQLKLEYYFDAEEHSNVRHNFAGQLTVRF